MKNLIIFFLVVAMVYACDNNKEPDEETIVEIKDESPAQRDSTLITDTSWGLITKTTDIVALKKIYGRANVKDESICGPECADTIKVTTLFRNTPKQIIVYWEDSAYHKRVMMAEASIDGSPYHTADGIKVGSKLSDLLKVNGKRIVFNGFGWDYGGIVTSFNDGKLGNSSLNIHLDLVEHTGQNELYGDRELHTDMPLVKQNLDKIIISTLTKAFLNH